MHRLLRVFATAMFVVFAGGSAFAAAPEGGSGERAEPTASEAPLVIFNRTVFVFRATLMGASPAVRASRARSALLEILRERKDLEVSVKDNPEGQLLIVGGSLVFAVAAADVDPRSHETHQDAANRAAAQLRLVIAESHEARSFDAMLRAAMLSVVATLVFALLLWGVTKLRRSGSRALLSLTARQAGAIKIADTHLIERQHLVRVLLKTMKVLRWLVVALLTYEWLGFVLSRFPYTRPWGERLNDYLLDVATNIIDGILHALPGLGVAAAIFLLARFFVGFLGNFLERLASSESALSWIGPDTMPTTRRLFNIGIWLFAIAMAYPYLPGAQTEAFKGISVLLGLMVSLGASSIVGQGAAGLILTYTRTMRPGEYVRVGENEGTVIRIGMFTTTIRTGLGEELTLPNSVITSAVTRNYSRTVDGAGFIVDTTVTIGYDTPWRQVEAMLIEAAKRTPGIIDPPAPRVFQTALADYYPEYRLVAQAIPSGPLARAEVLTRLHANIQDVFNEHGVQIMSPHYMMDPHAAKVVRPEDWYKAPAIKSGDETGRGA